MKQNPTGWGAFVREPRVRHLDPLGVVVLALLAAAAATGCKGKQPPKPPPPEVSVIRVISLSLSHQDFNSLSVVS